MGMNNDLKKIQCRHTPVVSIGGHIYGEVPSCWTCFPTLAKELIRLSHGGIIVRIHIPEDDTSEYRVRSNGRKRVRQ